MNTSKFCLCFGLSLLIGNFLPLHAELIINEFLYDPPGTDSLMMVEWLELYNSGTETVDLTNYRLEFAGKEWGEPVVFSSGTIMAGGFFLIEESEAATPLPAGYLASLDLQNGGTEADGVRLLNPAGIVLDTVIYASKANLNNLADDDSSPCADSEIGPTAANGCVLARWPNGRDTNNSANDFLSRKGDAATPGKSNGEETVTAVTTGPSAAILITEVAPSQSDGDWVEFYLLNSGEISGIKFLERSSGSGYGLVKEFPALETDAGSFILLHFDSNETDESGPNNDPNQNGVVDLYTADSGLTATDNVLYLTTPANEWLDVLVYSNRDGESFLPEADYQEAVRRGGWGPAVSTVEEYENNAAGKWEGKAGYSLPRKITENGEPQDTNSAIDWEITAYPTPGYGYRSLESVSESVFELLGPNPFSPYDSQASRRQIALRYFFPEPGFRTLRIFDVRGRIVRVLLDEHYDVGERVIYWDGRDEQGEILPIGIYLFHLESHQPESGKKRSFSKTVVLGRKL